MTIYLAIWTWMLQLQGSPLHTPDYDHTSFVSYPTAHSHVLDAPGPARCSPIVALERFSDPDSASRTTAHPTSAPPNLMPRKSRKASIITLAAVTHSRWTRYLEFSIDNRLTYNVFCCTLRCCRRHASSYNRSRGAVFLELPQLISSELYFQ